MALYQFCRRYVDRFNGDENSNPATNGEYRFLRNTLGAGAQMTVFDAGANIGDWTAFALSLNSELTVHCFEPAERSFARLSSRNWPGNVKLNRSALGDIEGEADLNIVAPDSGLNSLYVRRGQPVARATDSEKVAITTIDAYCRTNVIDAIDLIKIDVEGHELAVLKGMTDMLSKRRVHIIQFEYGGSNLDAHVTLADIWLFLQPFGFEFSKLYHNGPRRVPEYDQRLDTFRYSNWIAAQPGKAL